MSKKTEKSPLNGYSLALATAILGGITLSYDPFDIAALSRVIGIVLILVGGIGLSVETSELIKKNNMKIEGTTDLFTSAAVFIIWFFIYRFLEYINFLNVLSITFLGFLLLITIYGFILGFGKIIMSFFKNSHNKLDYFKLALRIIPIIISIIVLFLEYY